METQAKEAATCQSNNAAAGLEGTIQFSPEGLREHFGEFVRDTVETTLNAFLEAEAEGLCGAGRYQRSPERVDTRAGHYTRRLETRAGEVKLQIPKLRKLTFETQIIERYRRRESSVEEALVEMYLAGVSVRRVEDITEALWGTRVSASTVSQLNQKIYDQIEVWRNRPIAGEHPYVFLDAIWLKRSWGGEIKNVSVLVAMSVNREGFREILGASEGMKEDHASWEDFLRQLKARGLKGVRLFISDKCLGLVQAVAEIYPVALWQRCQVHFYRNVFAVTPKSRVREVAAMLKAIHSQENAEAARQKAQQVQAKLQDLKLERAAQHINEGIEETLRFYAFPRQHHIHIRTNNPLERINREIRRRTRVVGNFPDGRSALMLVCARLRHITHTRWGTRRYMDMSHLRDLENAPPELARDAFFEQKQNQEQPASNN